MAALEAMVAGKEKKAEEVSKVMLETGRTLERAKPGWRPPG